MPVGMEFLWGDNENENVLKSVTVATQPYEHITMTALSKLESDFITLGLYASKTSIYKNQSISFRF